ncbi:Uncharacterised protein [Listeria ivanovii subsp. londoniensis]|uniref:Uncharacterized protein n=2 Tax=Listeria ivanovii TaxID=1638 RepID=A0ABS1G232_LISIV|nr:hypothetical protein [Listeria ivanovii]EFR98505.1 conserved hypothetical protein [Listeria ivanovii FSL F6-596]AIS58562.1 hypothetical protein JL58_00495 [Listeria ivanovii subsp. londoniensis]MBK1960916.1 hypothetical protein [Listeria ivanovii subsp. londoniensis]SDW05641.1 hypothetical protein SAMN05421782_101249 [Listeria ivanovii]VEH44508.1 Uncharacterised protein [Listeria ivanovii subsp. londoniensis]
MSEIKVNKAILAQVVSKGQDILNSDIPNRSYEWDKTNIKPFENEKSIADDYIYLVAEIFRLVRYSEQSLSKSLSLVVKTAEAMEELDKAIGNGIASKKI